MEFIVLKAIYNGGCAKKASYYIRYRLNKGRLNMKIRKTIVAGKEVKVYIYENKKEESFVVSYPAEEWSFAFTYDDAGPVFVEKMADSLFRSGLEKESSDEMAQRIYQWTREM